MLNANSSPGQMSQVFFQCVEDCFEPIMLTDMRGQLVYVNPAWILTYGYSKEEALGRTPRILRSEKQSEGFYQSMWKTILDPAIGFWRGEVMNRAKDGHLVPVLLTITPYREPSGRVSGYMGIAVDLSDQKRMEEQILRQDRLSSIGLLASGLAHEIGNPLGVVRGRAELALAQVKGVSDVAEHNLEIVLHQIDRISVLIQSLLRVSRMTEEIVLNPTNVNVVVNEVVLLVSETFKKEEIEISITGLNVVVLGEASRMHQLFLNLMINALHAIQEKRRQESKISVKSGNGVEKDFVTITATTSANGSCMVSVKDSGCGVHPEIMSKLFQPFFTTKAAGVGTGLGLSIVMKLMDEMKGKVEFESPGPGLGATCKLEFRSSDF